MLILKADDENMRAAREDVSAFLWPDAKAGPRGASLGTLIGRFRAAFDGLPDPPLRIDDEAVAFVTEACDCDLLALRALLSSGDPRSIGAAARLMDEALLEGCETGSPSHRAWISARRESLSLEFARKATRALKSRLLVGNARLRETLEQKILDVRPIDPEAGLALAKLIKGRPGAKPSRSVSPSTSAAGQAELPLSRKD
jgi:DNA-binding SARP family transcriptional activator